MGGKMRITSEKIRKAIEILKNNKPKLVEEEWIVFLTGKERQVIIDNLKLAIRCHKGIWYNPIATVKDIEDILESLGEVV